MSIQEIKESDVDKLRAWVDDLRVCGPVEAPKAPTVQDPKPTQPVLKAPSEVPEQVRRTAGIMSSIHQRREERKRLVALGNSQRVAFEADTKKDQEVVAAQLEALRKEIEARAAKLKEDFEVRLAARNHELAQINGAVGKIDVSLEQLRKQLDVELGKLDPDRKVQG